MTFSITIQLNRKDIKWLLIQFLSEFKRKPKTKKELISYARSIIKENGSIRSQYDEIVVSKKWIIKEGGNSFY